jgi:hypothetical protein
MKGLFMNASISENAKAVNRSFHDIVFQVRVLLSKRRNLKKSITKREK